MGGGGGWDGVQIEVPYHHRLPSAELVNQRSVLLRSTQFHFIRMFTRDLVQNNKQYQRSQDRNAQ